MGGPEGAIPRHGSVFSIAMSPATAAIHDTLMTPSAKSEAMSAQQHPTHHAPFCAPIRSAPAGPPPHPARPGGPLPPRTEQYAEWTAALAQAHVLQWREFVDGGHEQRCARH